MALMETMDRMELALQRLKDKTAHMANPVGPFTMSSFQPFDQILRDAEPGEREMFRYVGPRTSAQTTHAPPSKTQQPLFEANPLQPATPLRAPAHNSSSKPTTDPEVLLGAALKLVDGYRPMPRKRKLILSSFERYETLREQILQLEDALANMDMPPPVAAVAKMEVDEKEDAAASAEPTVQDLIRQEEVEIKEIERKLQLARKARKPVAPAPTPAPPAPATPPPVPPAAARAPSPVPLASLSSSQARAAAVATASPPPTPPLRVEPYPLETPLITRFLSSSQNSRRASAYDPNEEIGDEDEPEMTIPALGGVTAGAEKEEDMTIQAPLTARDEEKGEEEEETSTSAIKEPLTVEEEPAVEDPAPPDVTALTPNQEAVLIKLWQTFPDILKQSPSASPDVTSLPPSETFALLDALAAQPIPSAVPSSSISLASTSAPVYPITVQGILLAHLIRLLLLSTMGDDNHFALPMGEVKRRIAAAVGTDEGAVTKAIFWGVGKRGLAIKRGGGEAKVVFA